MENWIPLGIGLMTAVLLNLFPWFMAFVVGSKKWQFVGWIYYLFTIPIGIVMSVIGLVVSLILVVKS